jgi:outer membrane lipoprotein-sorting protein
MPIMKRIIALLTAFSLAVAAFAQTPEEIITEMEETMAQLEVDGLVMAMDIKIPILGTMSSKAWNKGEKTRIEGEMMGVRIVTFIDGDTEWEYNSKENQVRIRRHDPSKESQEESNAKLFEAISEGYDVFLDKETATAWHIRCKKNKNNKEKDDPKTMDLVVAKGTYYPVSLSAKVSGITVRMYDLGFNVSEKQVTFDRADYPGATIIDER